MKAEMRRRIQMTFIGSNGILMRLKMGCRVQRKDMVLMIELMSKHFPIKSPAKCVRQHADEQC